ncbi:hypothetical protein QV08_09260 [Gallibacterium salpingitidis]|uniref:Transmembrane protein n=1 Tax=Gallibacterium salpingitidis TaxID=505341 RepID=A0A1A7Q6Y3_9PAST|nr:hypothetical protein [Gallibacterium salpingitidis]OBW96373.1 hypothetical protein QS62_00045 [Gallibacterium salpingitidis]OBX06749.1 hypothetical protein QV08_09260 [Gallibacterium salpingitidis]OBX09667.1 hypothetical protein QV09_07625 [Gallibacterium salpingitidis]WKS99480.1 hypothetical protein NYR30_12305 [Gallibacterium salpingitidis]
MEPMIYNTDNTKKWATIAYWLYILSFLVGFLSIVGVVIAYIFRDDARGSILESHFTYQIRTFWIGLLYSFIGVVLSLIFIGYFILLFTLIWLLVRSIKGLRALGKEQPILNEKTWLF